MKRPWAQGQALLALEYLSREREREFFFNALSYWLCSFPQAVRLLIRNWRRDGGLIEGRCQTLFWRLPDQAATATVWKAADPIKKREEEMKTRDSEGPNAVRRPWLATAALRSMLTV